MEGRRNSTDPMDLSGRSASSQQSAISQPQGMPSPSGYPNLPPIMGGQRFQAPGSPYQQRPFPSSPEQQRYFQMQQMQQQLRIQQMQQQQSSSSSSNASASYQRSQQKQQKPSLPGVMGPPSLTRPPNQTGDGSSHSRSSLPADNSNRSSSSDGPTNVTLPIQPSLVSAESMKSSPNSSLSNPPGTAPDGNKPQGPAKPKGGKSASSSKTSASELLPLDQAQHLLSQIGWVDKTIWVSRQLFGGQALNGFTRATATVQRVKKQRARQVNSTKAKAGEDKKRPPMDMLSKQDAEEVIKKDVMNARTAKKIKTELEQGMQFCEILHETICSILPAMNVQFTPPNPLDKGLPDPNAKNLPPVLPAAVANAMMVRTEASATTAPSSPLHSKKKTMTGASKMTTNGPQTASPGNPNGSTLRKQRRKKLPPNKEPSIPLSEYDESGKRKYPKKEQMYRITEVIRFRALRKGDFVAARVSSRDLWILAQVLENYNTFEMTGDKFLQLSIPRRDQLFRENVKIMDVEEKQEGNSVSVARSLVLPLPRSFTEAAEWGARAKKGTRVYAMYPQTTSLYSATVVDNTTYCRDDDDIIVVEFDGDEPDPTTGQLPKCHIPARFVVTIPREFPASQPASSSKKRSSSAPAAPMANSMVDAVAASLMDDPLTGLDDINLDGGLPGLEGFDDLEFDLLGGP